ncbi:putative bifunctional aspartokinase/homoserine dehydrogenase 1-like [Capsicum annuum]|nr:putative bifunctional aspartokinase/homoserine dehydrogenase 1-like [Capsicum annuum]
MSMGSSTKANCSSNWTKSHLSTWDRSGIYFRSMEIWKTGLAATKYGVTFSLIKEVVISKSYNHLLACLRYMKHDFLQMERTALMELKAVYFGLPAMKHDLLQMEHKEVLFNLVFVVIKSVNFWYHKDEHEWFSTASLVSCYVFSIVSFFFDLGFAALELIEVFQKQSLYLHKVVVRSPRTLYPSQTPLVGFHWISEMEIGLAVGGAFLSSALNVLFDRLAPHETSNQQVSGLNLSLSDDFFLNIKEKLEDTIETLKDLQKQIGLLGLKEHFASTKQETRRHSTSLVDESDVFGHPELEEVGKQIAAKCKGLHLALKTLAGIRFESEEQVIHLWIANGFVVPRGDERIQDLGNQFFLELRSRSLFERVRNPFQGNTEEFLMPDLVNDLAQIASSKLCVRLEEYQGSHMLDQSCHVSYSMGLCGDFDKLTPLNKLEQLRTLLPINIQYYGGIHISKRVLQNILPSLRSLRALSLSSNWIKELPKDLFIKLKLLRFLDLSQTSIKKLPDSICALYNLEALLLSSCYLLEELPLQMEKLINLRHFDISNTSRLKMSLHLSKLKRLQVLVGAKFILRGPCGWRMEDLGEAHYLYGSLSILELQNVVDRREALKVKMREKNHVGKLSLKWSESDADNSQTERDILAELRTHSNIKKLHICRYRGTQFPNWLVDHSFLKLPVQLSLSNCKDCYSLPALGQLPCLKFLSISEMHRKTEVAEEFYGSLSSEKPFNSLVKLEFAEMPEWKQWHVLGNGEFPALQDLSVDDCPKLVGKFPENLCSLTKLRISRCPELNLETPIQLSSLKWFGVSGSPKAGVLYDEAELFTSQLEGMKQIEELDISDCNSLTSFPISTLPSTLKTIWIWRCRKFKLEAPDSSRMNSNIFLEELRLDECDSISSPELVPRAGYLSVWRCLNLTRFLIPNGTERLYIGFCENLEILLSVACGTQMTSLNINGCAKMKRLPDSLLEQGLHTSLSELCLYDHDELHSLTTKVLRHLTSLQSLWIGNCHQLQSLPESALPSSLSVLTIEGCSNLQSLPESRFPSSLSVLTIEYCPNLQSLPVKGMPSSLSKLTIRRCPFAQTTPRI